MSSPAVPPAWPGLGWRQLGLLSEGHVKVSDDDEVTVIIDADASSRRAPLRADLPAHVHDLRFSGRRPITRAWLEMLPEVGAPAIALDVLPPAGDLDMLAGCSASLTTLRLGSGGGAPTGRIESLGFLARLPCLRHLELWGIDLRGSLARIEMTGVEHLRGGFVPDAGSGRWRGLDWLKRFPALRSLELAAVDADPQSLRNLAALPRLESLTLDWFEVLPDVVATWRSLPRLRELRLGGADIERAAISRIAELPALQALELSEVELGELELGALAAAQALESLALECATVAAPIGVLAPLALSRLHIVSSTLDDTALDSLARLVSLQSLDLTDTTADDHTASAASELPALRELSLRACERVSLPPRIADRGFRGLRSLDISSTLVDSVALRSLASLPHLEILGATDLSAVNERDALEFSESLTALHLDRTPLGRPATTAIARCEALETLTLEGSRMDAVQLAPLASLTRLRCLRLSPRHGLPRWLAGLISLDELRIDRTSLPYDELRVLQDIPSLVRLELLGCSIDSGAHAAIAGLPRLEALSLRLCELSAGDVLGELPEGLRHFDVSDSNVGDADLVGLSGVALESLEFDQTAVTAAGLLTLGDTPRLDALIGVFPPMSDGKRQQLAEKFPACWTLPKSVQAMKAGADASDL